MDWTRTLLASAARLDKLINLVERLSDAPGNASDLVPELTRTLAGIETFPFGHLLGEADLAAQSVAAGLGKKVRVKIDLPELEIPLTFKEVVSRAIVHSIRNAVGHGIETSEARRKAAKDPTGTVLLSPRLSGDSLELCIQDDGRGPDLERAVAKAIEIGSIPPTSADRLQNEQKLELLFHSGVSTAERVTELSGRGMGLDAIAEDWRLLGGEALAEIPENRVGFRLRLRAPLQLIGLEAVPVRCGPCMLWIPAWEFLESSPEDHPADDVRIPVLDALKIQVKSSKTRSSQVRVGTAAGAYRIPGEVHGAKEFRSFRRIDPSWGEQGEEWLRHWLVRFPTAFGTRSGGRLSLLATVEMLASLSSLK